MTAPLTHRDLINLKDQVDASQKNIKEISGRCNAHTGVLATQATKIDHLIDENNELKAKLQIESERIRKLERAVERLSERTTLFQLAQATWTTVASVVSTILSVNIRY